MLQKCQTARGRSEGIRVLVADDHRIDCELLTGALRRSRHRFDVVASGTGSAALRRALAEKRADVVLLSANLGEGPFTGFAVLRELRASFPDSRVVMLLDCSERDLVVDAFRAGARGVFCRSNSFDALCKCITAVHQGQIWASTDQLQFVLEALAQAAPLRVVNSIGAVLLARREMDVVRLIAEGHSNREISARLSLSEHTVKNYLFRIFDKLGISSRVELVLYALSGRQPASAEIAPVLPPALPRESALPQPMRSRSGVP